MRITKAVITAAGFATHFLPATKVVPKELLPLIDRPIIQYSVEEAVESGIKEIAIVTRPRDMHIQKYFLANPTLEAHLRQQRKQELLKTIKKIEKMAKFSFFEQKPNLPYGTASTLVTIRNFIKKGESFVFIFGDDLVLSKIPATKQLLNRWQKNPQAVILAVQKIPLKEVNRYGMVKLERGRVVDFVEKPEPEKAPSCLASLGRFIFKREIIDWLLARKDKERGRKEFCHADAIAWYAKKGTVLTQIIKGKWLTTGDPLRYLKATIEYALVRKDISKEFKDFLRNLNV